MKQFRNKKTKMFKSIRKDWRYQGVRSQSITP